MLERARVFMDRSSRNLWRMTTMVFWRRFFCFAGLFNLLGGAAGFFTYRSMFADAGLPSPLYHHPFQLIFILVMILGIGYLMVWRDPMGHRGIVWIGLLTKVAGFFVSLHALRLGELPQSSALQPWIVDFPFVIAFGLFLAQTRAGSAPAAERHPDPKSPNL